MQEKIEKFLSEFGKETVLENLIHNVAEGFINGKDEYNVRLGKFQEQIKLIDDRAQEYITEAKKLGLVWNWKLYELSTKLKTYKKKAENLDINSANEIVYEKELAQAESYCTDEFDTHNFEKLSSLQVEYLANHIEMNIRRTVYFNMDKIRVELRDPIIRRMAIENDSSCLTSIEMGIGTIAGDLSEQQVRTLAGSKVVGIRKALYECMDKVKASHRNPLIEQMAVESNLSCRRVIANKLASISNDLTEQQAEMLSKNNFNNERNLIYQGVRHANGKFIIVNDAIVGKIVNANKKRRFAGIKKAFGVVRDALRRVRNTETKPGNKETEHHI